MERGFTWNPSAKVEPFSQITKKKMAKNINYAVFIALNLVITQKPTHICKFN